MKKKSEIIKAILWMLVIFSTPIIFINACVGDESNPYTEGAHWDYNISYENGIVYKNVGIGRSQYAVLDSNGNPLKVSDIPNYDYK